MLAAWGILSAALLAPSQVLILEVQEREDRSAKDSARSLELAVRELHRSMRLAPESLLARRAATEAAQEAAFGQGGAWPALEGLPGFVSFFSLSPMQEGEVHRVVMAYGPNLEGEAPAKRESAPSAAAAFSRGF